MYKEIYYVIGNPLECDENFMDSTDDSYFTTIGQAKSEIERRVKCYACRRKDYEIAKVTMIIERDVK